MDLMPRPRLPYLHTELTRHGKRVWYVRKGKGPRIRLKAAFGTEAFREEYDAALAGAKPVQAATTPNSLKWAIDRYRKSSAWAGLSNATRKQKENIFRRVIAASGSVPLSKITEKAIRKGREARQATPHAANNFIKAMRSLFAWAVEEKLVAANPAKLVSLLAGPNDDKGFHTWTADEMDVFEATYRVGTRERLAFDLLLYTGLRRGDAVRVGRQHVKDGIIVLRSEKTNEEQFLPILEPLAQSLAASPTGDLAFLVNAYGQPWVKESFGNWFGEICEAAGMPQCSAHGLRKAGATRAAERGATDQQLMALYGWRNARMATHYTRSASKRKLSMDAAKLLLPETSREQSIPAPSPRKARTVRKSLSRKVK